jgi:hypothetical protein
MGNIREHRSDSPTKQGARPQAIVDGIGEDRIARLPHFGYERRMQVPVVGMDGRAGEALGYGPPILRDPLQQQAPRDPWATGTHRRQGFGVKARNQRLRKSPRPQPEKHHSDQRPGFSFAAASGFYLDICADAKLAQYG